MKRREERSEGQTVRTWFKSSTYKKVKKDGSSIVVQDFVVDDNPRGTAGRLERNL